MEFVAAVTPNHPFWCETESGEGGPYGMAWVKTYGGYTSCYNRLSLPYMYEDDVIFLGNPTASTDPIDAAWGEFHKHPGFVFAFRPKNVTESNIFRIKTVLSYLDKAQQAPEEPGFLQFMMGGNIIETRSIEPGITTYPGYVHEIDIPCVGNDMWYVILIRLSSDNRWNSILRFGGIGVFVF